MRVTPLGLCLRVNVNEKSPTLEKTTLRFLFLLLFIYGDILAFQWQILLSALENFAACRGRKKTQNDSYSR